MIAFLWLLAAGWLAAAGWNAAEKNWENAIFFGVFGVLTLFALWVIDKITEPSNGGQAGKAAGTYPPQRTVQDVSRSYDPTGAMATQRTDYGDVNEVARVAYDHANGGTGAGVTGKVVVYDSDYNQHETGEYIKVIQHVAHQGNNNLTIERRRGNRP